MASERIGDVDHHPHAAGDVHQLVLSAIPSGRGMALDAACGDGTVSKSLAERGYTVEAVDLPSTPPFDAPPAVRYRPVDLNAPLPYEDESFDLIVSIETIEHLENPSAYLRELARVAKNGASLYITTPNVASVWSRASFLVFGRPLWFHPWDLNPLGHVTPIFPHILDAFARSAHLDVISRRYSEGRIPVLQIRVPMRSPHFGECMIVELRKR